MNRYILRRLLGAIPTLLGVSVCVFLLLQAIPGGPLSMYENNPGVTAEDLARLRKTLGLDGSPPEQYMRWLQNVLRGDLGWSLITNRPVLDVVFERLPNTLLLVGAAFVLALVFSVPIGMISARYQYSLLDQIATTVALAGESIPVFWFGLVLIIIFNLWLRWLPGGGMFTIGEPFSLLDRARYLILPAFMLSMTLSGRYTRFIRGSMLEVIHHDYVRTARSKGLGERTVLFRHVLKNAAIPVVTIVAMDLPMLFSGALYTELIFSWAGTGRLFFDAADRRDYPVIMALIMVTAALIVLFNLLADLLYAYLDPRVRYR